MDRSLKWRTGILFAILLYCVVMVLPTIVSKTSLPGWFRAVSDNEINLGLDLQGGLYIVYDIDVAKAIDDRASEIKRDLDAKFADMIRASRENHGQDAVVILGQCRPSPWQTPARGVGRRSRWRTTTVT
ncbi:MAG: hypothetical protein IPI49_33675 [Myxococcales bacterium]|nr:hypothetical protein [Myxococcales bacterium]